MKTALKFWSLLFLLSSTVLSGQELQQASFSADQAARGAALYQQNCAACHLANLTGSFEAPNLADTSFRSNWANRRVEEFVDLLQRTMPPQAPGSLDQRTSLPSCSKPTTSTALSLSAGNVLFLDTEAGTAGVLEQRTPVPGRAGTVPRPARATPEIATIYQSERARTRSFEPVNRFRNVSNEELANPPAADWTYWRRSPQSQGFTRSDYYRQCGSALPGLGVGMEKKSYGIIFIPNFGNVVQALDGRTGNLLWEYRRQFPEGERSGGLLRTLAMWEDFRGQPMPIWLHWMPGAALCRWDSEIADEALGYSNTSGPIVADGVVINGISGCGRFFEQRCFITGHDAATGNCGARNRGSTRRARR